MKNKVSIALLLICPFLATGSMAGISKKQSVPTVASSAVKDKRYNITAYGAVGDSTTLNTKAIQSAIDKCAQGGGGTVVIPKGIFLSGSIFIKPGVNIEMEEGSVLKGSTNIEDYPKGNTRIEGHFEPWRSALINADKVDHLHITGKGILDGSGRPFWTLFYSRRSADPKNTTNLSVERPRLAFIQNCKDVTISGISFTNSGFWNLHLYRNQGVKVDNCRFVAPSGRIPDHAPSSDGIDVDSDQDVTISNCYFSVGDDDIALKGSKGPFALQDKDSPPVEHIRIQDCTFENGGGVVTCGSEATLVRDVKIERCTTSVNVLQLKLRPDTPQQYEDITVNDITLKGNATVFKVAPWSQYFDLKGQAPPKSTVRNIVVSNIKGTGSSLGSIAGHDLTTFGDITLKDVNVTLKNADMRVGNISTLKFENVVVNGSPMQAPAPTVKPKPQGAGK